MNHEILIISGGPLDEVFGIKYYSSWSWDYIIAADAGLRFCRRADILPDLVIGDFDSVGNEAFNYFHERIPERFRIFPSEKDETDTELALAEAVKYRKQSGADAADSIHIIGALGGRVDHLLGNLALLALALEQGAPCCLVDEKTRIRMTDSEMILKKDQVLGKYISLIPFAGAVDGLTLSGFKYNVNDFSLRPEITRGISNEISDGKAVIHLKHGRLLVIETSD